MGKRGPIAKPPARAQGHRMHAEPVVLEANAPHAVPRPPTGLSPLTRRDWQAYWASPVARASTDVDLPAIRRLFRYRDQLERAMALLEQAMLVKCSMGQIRVNPLGDHIAKLESMILRLEVELGLTPMSRSRLGIQVGEAALTLDDLNQRFGDADDGTDEDRRLQLVRDR